MKRHKKKRFIIIEKILKINEGVQKENYITMILSI